MTAHYLTSTCNADLIKPGEWCLIHGVGGGTCQWAAQVCLYGLIHKEIIRVLGGTR